MTNEDNKPVWMHTSVTCDLCSYKWEAVHHKDTERLECNNCGNFTIFD